MNPFLADRLGAGQLTGARMERDGFESAIIERELIYEAYRKLYQAPDYERALVHWADFLNRFQRIFNKLTAASAKSPKAKAWMQKNINERKSDELLRYLHQARHSDEHGFGPLADNIRTVRIPGIISTQYVKKLTIDSDGTVTVDGTDQHGNRLRPQDISTISRIRLKTVINRGVSFDPPKMHLGQTVDPDDIHSVAQLVLTYVDRMFGEAKDFLRPNV